MGGSHLRNYPILRRSTRFADRIYDGNEERNLFPLYLSSFQKCLEPFELIGGKPECKHIKIHWMCFLLELDPTCQWGIFRGAYGV